MHYRPHPREGMQAVNYQPKKTMKTVWHSYAGVQPHMNARMLAHGHRGGRYGRFSLRWSGLGVEMLCRPVYAQVVVANPPVPSVDAFGEKCAGCADAPLQLLSGITAEGYHAPRAHGLKVAVDLHCKCPEILILAP